MVPIEFNGTMDQSSIDWMDVLDNILGSDSIANQGGAGGVAVTDSAPLSSDTSDDGSAQGTTNTARPAVEKPKNTTTSSAENEEKKSSSNDTSKEEKLSAEEKAQARSERKRRREKQRRSDVNSQFSDLTTLLRKVQGEDDSDDEGETADENLKLFTNNPTNRVDLIARTISVLNRVHRENNKRRRIIVDLKKELKEVKEEVEKQKQVKEEAKVKTPEQNQVMMMVPMMVGPDGIPRPSPHAASYMSHAMQFFPPMYHPPAGTTEAPQNNPYMFPPPPVWTKKSEPTPYYQPPPTFHMGDEDKNYNYAPSEPAQEGFAPPAAVSVTDVGANLAHCA